MAPRVVLGVAGGIAAYKAVEVLRGLTESGCDVTVVPTAAALRFVAEPTWAALSGRPVPVDLWADAHEVPHVRLGRQADLVLVVPATADILARAVAGLADDLLTNVLLTAGCPVLFAPAMHNVGVLRQRGALVLDPADGRLTGADSGPGRLPDPAEIVAAAWAVLRRGSAGADLAGRHVVVSAGGTQEAWDPVRFLGNRSSGRQGVELARTALARGARVTLVAAHLQVAAPAGARVVPVDSAEDLRQAVHAAAGDADAVVMAAAVADFRPAAVGAHKIKREGVGEVLLPLTANPDVLAELVAARAASASPQRPVLVGFAAETGSADASVLDLGRAKLARKGCDLLVVNDVSDGKVFGQPDNEVVIVHADGSLVAVPPADKATIADAIWDQVAGLLPPIG